MKLTRFGALFTALAVFLLTATSLSATQPFWSMEPSTMTIQRADSLTGFDVSKYIISLVINEQTHFIDGSVEAFVTAEEDLSHIQYRLMGGTLAVSEVQVNGVSSSFTHQDGIIDIPLAIALGQQFTTKVFYSGVPGNSPAPYNIGLIFGTSTIYTLSNPDAGRYWWPSYDHPWDKALVDWHITVRQDWLAAANGIRTGITDNGDGTRTHHWVCSSPVATYVIGFAAGGYIEFAQQAGTLPIQNFVLPGQLSNSQIDFANVPEMIDCFSGLFGAYPFEKYGHMVVNMATYAAMEHQTMTTYGSQYLTGNQAHESIVAHELAHQWYGNYVTPITMREVWLKESFATYSEALWTHHKSGWQAACDYMKGSIQQYYITWENSNGPHTIFNPEYNLMFAPPTYEKSASVLHMLRLKMGNDAFFTFIRSLLTTYPNGNLNTAEFITLAQQASGQDLTQFFQQWIFSPGIPNATLNVFTNGATQAKVYAQSTSPTATQFYMDIPLHVPGSVVADSVVVMAAPNPQVNYFAIAASDDLSSIQIDPHNWVLTRQLTDHRMQLQSCLPYKSAVSLGWSAYSATLPIAGYHAYRRQLPSGELIRLTNAPLEVLSYTDMAVENGNTYRYYVCAVDVEGYISLPSNTMDAMPIAFPFDEGFLVVDETRNGNGSSISPTEETVDAFYDAVLEGFTYEVWDYDAKGAPSLDKLSHHPVILWHADDFSELLMQHSLDLIGSYVLSGGKLLVSGWKYPSVFSAGFSAQFLPTITPTYHNSAVLVSLQSSVYPALHPDPAKLAAAWNGRFPMSYTFAGATDILYTAEMLDAGTGNGEPAAIRIQNGGTMVLLGFPLYFMLQEEVKGFLAEALPQLYPAINGEVPPVGLKLTCYPNPFSGTSNLNIKLDHATAQELSLYNLRGQRVYSTTLIPAGIKGNSTIITIPSEVYAGLGSGCYFLKLVTDQGTHTRKVVYLK